MLVPKPKVEKFHLLPSFVIFKDISWIFSQIFPRKVVKTQNIYNLDVRCTISDCSLRSLIGKKYCHNCYQFPDFSHFENFVKNISIFGCEKFTEVRISQWITTFFCKCEMISVQCDQIEDDLLQFFFLEWFCCNL